MAIIVGRNHLIGDVPAEIVRLEALAADLRKLHSGTLPGRHELWAAPVLNTWSIAIDASGCRVVRGIDGQHPALLGRLAKPTDIWVWAPDRSWLRTASGFYRLGRPLAGEDRA